MIMLKEFITGLTILRFFRGVAGSLTMLDDDSCRVVLTIVFGVVVEFESDSFSFSSLS